MSYLDDLGRDLRDKRLWPVAGLLAIALPAIPLIPHGSGTDRDATVPAPAAPQAAAPQATSAAIAYEPAPTTPQRRPGALHDPFAHSGGTSGSGSGASTTSDASSIVDLGDQPALSSSPAAASKGGSASPVRSATSAASASGSSSAPAALAGLGTLSSTAAEASAPATSSSSGGRQASAPTGAATTTPATTTTALPARAATTPITPATATVSSVATVAATTTVPATTPVPAATTTATVVTATTAPAAPVTAPEASPDSSSAPTRLRIGLRFRPVGGADARTVRDATRLLALPSPATPVAVLLGATPGGRHAVFLVSDQVTAWGEGTCTLQVTGCPALKLGVGSTELLDAPAKGGGLARFALTVTSIDRVDASAPAQRRLRTRRSEAGARLLRAAMDAGSPVLDRYRWSAARGVVLDGQEPG